VRQFVLDVYRQAKLRALTRSEGWFNWIIAAGLVGWLVLSAAMLQTVLRLDFRSAIGGNWPMINVIGPKIWGVPLVASLERPQWQRWDDGAATATVAGVLLVVACVWLITIRRPDTLESWRSPRRVARWGATILVGTAIGIVIGFGREGAVVRAHSIYSAFTLPLTMFVEGPATLLVYLYLAAIARRQSDPSLARHLSWAGLLAVMLILGGNGMFFLSRLGVDGDGLGGGGALVFLMVASYGLSCVAVGLWATWSVLRLIRLLVLPERASEYRQLSLFEG
jgi:hypothetical protein